MKTQTTNERTLGHDWHYVPRGKPLFNPWGADVEPIYVRIGQDADGYPREAVFKNQDAYDMWRINGGARL